MGYVTNIDLIRGRNIKLSIQLVLEHHLFVIAVGRQLVFLRMIDLHTARLIRL